MGTYLLSRILKGLKIFSCQKIISEKLFFIDFRDGGKISKGTIPIRVDMVGTIHDDLLTQ